MNKPLIKTLKPDDLTEETILTALFGVNKLRRPLNTKEYEYILRLLRAAHSNTDSQIKDRVQKKLHLKVTMRKLKD